MATVAIVAARFIVIKRNRYGSVLAASRWRREEMRNYRHRENIGWRSGK